MTQKQAEYCIEGMEEFGIVEKTREFVSIRLPIPPSSNRYWRNFNGRMVVSEEAKQYKWQVALLCGQLDQFAGNVSLTIDVYRPRKLGDLDNYLKVTLDSLINILYPDDSAVVEIHARRHDDKDNPCIFLRAKAAA